MSGKTYLKLILTLGSLTALGPFSIDMYLPGFPAIARDLHTTVPQVAYSLSSYFIGISIGQLIYGPLLDRFGRKYPLYVGLLIYIAAALGCFASASIDALIVWRFVQAIGGCAASVAAMAMVRDLFPVSDIARVFSKLILVVGLSPLIAPTAGGYLTAALGWQSVFVSLAIIAVLILTAVRFTLPETKGPDPSHVLHPVLILRNFWSILKTPQFYTYTLAGSIAFSGLFVYISGSPVVFMEYFRVTERQYGWIFAFLAMGLIGASQMNTLLLKRYRSEQIVLAAMVCQSLIGIFFYTGITFGWLGLGGTIATIFCFLSCAGLTMPNSTALSLAPFERNAGSASSVMGAMQMGIGALATVVVGSLDAHSAVPMAGAMAMTAMLGLMILTGGSRMMRSMQLSKATS